MPDLHQFPVYSLVDQDDAAELLGLLKAEGWGVRHLSSVGARDRSSFLLGAAESLRFTPPASWSGLADLLPEAVLPGTGGPSRTALVWWGAGELASASLGTLLAAFDVLVDMARRAYESDMDVAVFLLGAGPGFPPLADLLSSGLLSSGEPEAVAGKARA